MKPDDTLQVDLDELAFALDQRPQEGAMLLDLKTGELGYFSEDLLRADEAYEDPELYLPVDPIDSHLSFSIMEDFLEDLPSGRPRESLYAALERRKPFRAFKHRLAYFPDIREAWFKFRDERLVELALEWLQDHAPQATAIRKGRAVRMGNVSREIEDNRG